MLMVVVVIFPSTFSTVTLGYEARIVDDYEGRDLIVDCLSKAEIVLKVNLMVFLPKIM